MSSCGERLDIICFPDAPWDAPLLTNRQQVMRRFASSSFNVRVLYVEPPQFCWTRDARYNGSSIAAHTHQVSERLWVVSPPLWLPNRLMRRFAFRQYQDCVVQVVRRTQERLGFTRPVLWTYSPLAADYLGKLNERAVCYDCVDDYLEQDYYAKGTGTDVAGRERQLLQAANLLLFTWEGLAKKKGCFDDPRTYCVGNAADYGLFARATCIDLSRPLDLVDTGRPVVGFFGAIDDSKVDGELLMQLATRHPEWELVLIGPVRNFRLHTKLRARPNIHFLGVKQQRELPEYLRFFDVCMIPYVQNEYTSQLYSLKLHEYFAAGKPVVSTDLPFIHQFSKHLYVSTSVDEFCTNIERALGEDVEAAERRQEIAWAHSWEHKSDYLLDLLCHKVGGTDVSHTSP